MLVLWIFQTTYDIIFLLKVVLLVGNYTDKMEDAIFEQLDNFDEYSDECSELIETINSKDFFRSFGEALLSFLQKYNPELTQENVVKYIEELCVQTSVTVKDIATVGTLNNWFKGGLRPKKGHDSRKSMFALAFALRLSPVETAELFHKVYLDRAFDYRNEKEIIYYYCLLNKKSWSDASRLIDSIDIIKHSEDYTIYTSQIYLDIQNISEETALLSYINKHGNNLSKKSESAKSILKKLKEEAIVMVETETQLQEKRLKAEKEKITMSEMYKENIMISSFENTNSKSLNHIYEVITGCLVRDKDRWTGTKTLFKNARLPKEIRSRFPEAGTLSKKDPTYEEIRKLILLLFSYNFWVKSIKNNELIELDNYIDELNVHLNESGLSLVYFGNPYDWLFLYCGLSNNPLDTFRAIISEVLEIEE